MMKQLIFILFLGVALAGCAQRSTRALPNVWRPVNTFDDQPKAIPLFRPYVYAILEVDRTLMQMTRRWAKDSQIEFEYSCDDDFSLPARLNGRVFKDVDSAIAAVNETYSSFGVTVAISSSNKLTGKCTDRDSLTGIARLPLSLPTQLPNNSSTGEYAPNAPPSKNKLD